MTKNIKIGDRELFMGAAPFIVAEAGINHNGELDKAFQMIIAAKKAGVDAVKFQTFKAREFIADEDLSYTYKSQGKEVTESMLKMFERCEFSPSEWHQIKKKCDEEGITFLSTPQNVSDLHLLLELGITAIKVGSDDFTNLPLLKSYCETGLPLIVSSGMANLAEIYESLETIGAFNGYPTILLQCTSSYPTPPEDVNIKKMKTLRGAFPNLCLGFSDHTQGPLASSLAVAMGAVFFEKHFTLSHDLPGPDHWFSEEPADLAIWAHSIRTAHQMLGSEHVRPTKKEEENKHEYTRSVVAKRAIEPGELLTEENMSARRLTGGNGIPVKLLPFLVSRKILARKRFEKNEAICL